MEWLKTKDADKDGLTIPDTWLHIHYYEALSCLFRIENALRTFVFLVLKTEAGDSWPTFEIYSDDGNHTTIASLAKKRIAQNETFGYLGFTINSPLMHLTSGELVGLITSDSYWKYFSRYFRAVKRVVTLKLQEIGNIRNSLAHFRPITSDDVEVVKQNANQVLSGVENALIEATSCIDRVPTNTQETWYREISTLGTQQCQFLLNQSQNKDWVRITLQFSCSASSYSGLTPSTLAVYEALKLDSPECIKKFINIRQNLAILTEEISFPGWEAKSEMSFRKDLQFTFAAKLLGQNHEKIKADFEGLISQIAEEVELISEDHLARGELIRLVKVRAWEKKGASGKSYWRFDMSPLLRPVQANDPEEYWGNLEMSSKDLVTKIDKFPWMPVSISKPPVPF
ncbi:MAG TPA: hypothetical protein PLA74_01345 [Syntrophales bacterium]|nr:hypothetical protein [Syntrophales bacterium]HPQ42763.1 hypothetical protein [Syntrophales bacterium]